MHQLAKEGAPAAIHARTFWKSYGQALIDGGRLTDLDYAAFEALSWSFGSLKACEHLLAREGETIQNYQERGDHLRTQAHPAAAARNKHRTQFFALAQQFGLTPKSRGQIKLTDSNPADQQDDDLT
jgi:P27 family predicted phage terminase small subunit